MLASFGGGQNLKNLLPKFYPQWSFSIDVLSPHKDPSLGCKWLREEWAKVKNEREKLKEKHLNNNNELE